MECKEVYLDVIHRALYQFSHRSTHGIGELIMGLWCEGIAPLSAELTKGEMTTFHIHMPVCLFC